MRTGLFGIRSTMESTPGDRALRRRLTGRSPAPRPRGSSSYMALSEGKSATMIVQRLAASPAARRID